MAPPFKEPRPEDVLPIVGLELEILGVQGKWKLSQNQPAPNRQARAPAWASRRHAWRHP